MVVCVTPPTQRAVETNALPHHPGCTQVARSAPVWRWKRRTDLDGITDSATAGKALVLGASLSGANPKNFVLAAAAATSKVEAGVHGTDLVVAVVVFVLVGSFTVVGAVVVNLVGGRRGKSPCSTMCATSWWRTAR